MRYSLEGVTIVGQPDQDMCQDHLDCVDPDIDEPDGSDGGPIWRCVECRSDSDCTGSDYCDKFESGCATPSSPEHWTCRSLGYGGAECDNDGQCHSERCDFTGSFGAGKCSCATGLVSCFMGGPCTTIWTANDGMCPDAAQPYCTELSSGDFVCAACDVDEDCAPAVNPAHEAVEQPYCREDYRSKRCAFHAAHGEACWSGEAQECAGTATCELPESWFADPPLCVLDDPPQCACDPTTDDGCPTGTDQTRSRCWEGPTGAVDDNSCVQCLSHADCVGAVWFESGQEYVDGWCDGARVCQPKKFQGESCSQNKECAYGAHCLGTGKCGCVDATNEGCDPTDPARGVCVDPQGTDDGAQEDNVCVACEVPADCTGYSYAYDGASDLGWCDTSDADLGAWTCKKRKNQGASCGGEDADAECQAACTEDPSASGTYECGCNTATHAGCTDKTNGKNLCMNGGVGGEQYDNVCVACLSSADCNPETEWCNADHACVLMGLQGDPCSAEGAGEECVGAANCVLGGDGQPLCGCHVGGDGCAGHPYGERCFDAGADGQADNVCGLCVDDTDCPGGRTCEQATVGGTVTSSCVVCNEHTDCAGFSYSYYPDFDPATGTTTPQTIDGWCRTDAQDPRDWSCQKRKPQGVACAAAAECQANCVDTDGDSVIDTCGCHVTTHAGCDNGGAHVCVDGGASGQADNTCADCVDQDGCHSGVEYCDELTRTCEPSLGYQDTCTEDVQCEPGLFCCGVNFVCYPDGSCGPTSTECVYESQCPECTEDSDCPGTQYCNGLQTCTDKKAIGGSCAYLGDHACLSGHCCDNALHPTDGCTGPAVCVACLKDIHCPKGSCTASHACTVF